MEELRIAEINEYVKLDNELIDAQIAEDEQAIKEVNERIKEFEARSKFIDFTPKHHKPFQRPLYSPDVINIPTFSSLLRKSSDS